MTAILPLFLIYFFQSPPCEIENVSLTYEFYWFFEPKTGQVENFPHLGLFPPRKLWFIGALIGPAGFRW